MVSSKLLRAFLDDAADAAVNAGIFLRPQLRVFETSAREVLAGGSFSSTSANGRHIAYAGSMGGQISQVDVCEAWRRLIDTYDIAATEISAVADGSQDDKIKTQMMLLLREIMGTTNNFMYLSK